jgi:uncharacterized DUF497 family protein
MAIRFEWDINKAATNAQKHSITFEEATTVFRDLYSLTIADPDHSTESEERWITLGRSVRNRLLVVVHFDLDDQVIRIISARPATRFDARQI